MMIYFQRNEQTSSIINLHSCFGGGYKCNINLRSNFVMGEMRCVGQSSYPVCSARELHVSIVSFSDMMFLSSLFHTINGIFVFIFRAVVFEPDGTFWPNITSNVFSQGFAPTTADKCGEAKGCFW